MQGMKLDVQHLMGLERSQAAEPRSIPADLSADDVVAACMKHFVACAFSARARERVWQARVPDDA
jgi:hypothetical protein